MNYGPLAQAIDSLVEAKIDRYKCKNYEEFQAYDAAVRKAADKVARAQDQFYLDVKEGRLVQDN